jgi:hypothetical protein
MPPRHPMFSLDLESRACENLSKAKADDIRVTFSDTSQYLGCIVIMRNRTKGVWSSFEGRHRRVQVSRPRPESCSSHAARTTGVSFPYIQRAEGAMWVCGRYEWAATFWVAGSHEGHIRVLSEQGDA